MLQLTLGTVKPPKKKKRVRTAPVWDKFYSVYKFDSEFYHKLCYDVKFKPNLPPFIIKTSTLTSKNLLKLVLYLIITHSLTIFEKEIIRDFCYIRDDNGIKSHCGDQNHIYRYKTLVKLRSALVNYITTDDFQRIFHSTENSVKIDKGLYTIYAEKYDTDVYFHRDMVNPARNPAGATYKGQKFEVFEVEINNTENLPLKERIQLHINLLRKLRKGQTFDEVLQ